MAIKPVEILITAKDKASGVFDLLKKNATSLGATLAAYFGVRAFFGAVQGAAELEAKLSDVKAVSGATAQEMVLLRKAAEEAGATTKFSATEGAEALGNLARAGLSVQESIAALPPTLQLAQAGQVDLARAAQIVTTTLAGFNLEASQSGRIADVLAKGANASNTSVEGLAQALSYAAPTAQSLNLSLETTVALLGKFADGGIDASRGGTALNAILSQFLDPASKFRSELAAMGITTNNFEDALRQLAAAGPAGQKAILAVGMEAGPALRALLNQGIGAFDDLKRQLAESSGSAAEFARIVEDNLTGASLGLGSAWDTVKIALATPVLPVLKDGVQQLTGALREAVSNGTVGKFGDAIAKGFQAALEWGRRFLAEVDVEALVAKMQSGADRVGTAFDTVSTYATNAGSAVQLVWGTMAAGANSVLTAIYSTGAAFSATAAGIVSGAAQLSEALSKIAVTDEARNRLQAEAAQMREVLGGLNAVTTEFVDKANAAMDGVASNAQLARDAWAGLTTENAAAADQAATSEAVFKSVGETLKEVGGDATAMGDKTKAATILQTEAVRKVRAEVEGLKTEYEAALKAGDVQTAVSKLQQMQSALQTTAAKADDTAAAVKAAFTSFGIQTKAELEDVANRAKVNFELIKQSGQATTDGLQQAFKRYAEAAIAANGGVASDVLKIEASMRGLSITSDETGKAIVNAATNAATAVGSIGRAAGTSADQFAAAGQRMTKTAEDIARANAKAFNQGTGTTPAQDAAAAKKAAEVTRQYGRPGQYSTQKGNENNYDPGRNMYGRAGQNDQPRNGNGQTQAEYDRAERLKGQGASDETLLFALLDKLQAGTLSPDDLDELRAVVQTLKNNEAIFRNITPGGNSLEALEDDRKWMAARVGFEQAIAKFSGGSGAPGAQSVGRTIKVDINTGSGRETVNTDEAGAQAVVRALGAAARRAGR